MSTESLLTVWTDNSRHIHIERLCGVCLRGVRVCERACVAPVSVCCVWNLEFLWGNRSENSKKWRSFKRFAIYSTLSESIKMIAVGKYLRRHFSTASTAFSTVHSFFIKPKPIANTPMTFSWHRRQLSFPSHSSRSLWKCQGYSNSSIDASVSPKKVRQRRTHSRVLLYNRCNWTWSIFNEVKNRFLSNSSGVSGIEGHLRWNKSTHWKLDPSHLFFHHESNSGVLDYAKVCHQHIHVLHDRQGPRCTQITHSNVVSFAQSLTSRIDFHSIKVYLVCSFELCTK